MIGSSNDETNFANKLLLTNSHVSKIPKAFLNGTTATINIKFSKHKLSRMIQSGRFMIGAYDIINLIKLLKTCLKILPKVINKAEYLTKKGTVNYMIKTADTSKYFIKISWNRNKFSK